ncbi:MAG: hypothetical protein IPI00_11725 [Flavobacteriales bacterium]|nr:hypothetical protein [Flavobacteriales bacterium]MBK6943302.1 hypothetical protein [Flavobacteriales bacterium]MBK7240820.1 hypothetical protein [Flavobacteriales bacterium]MBK9536168.1 hypothetical protein [Flavobacteriales bacterium]MBP9139745.1 hypothetical protein [Flavobacteriales bacterium]
MKHRIRMVLPYSIKSAVGAGLCLFLFACGDPAHETDSTKAVDSLTTTTPKETEVLNIGGKLFSIPSPTQTAMAMRSAGLEYHKESTAPLEKGGTATSKTSQSLLLGVFGADLSYSTVHKDGQRALATMQAIEKLGGKLEVANAFDKALLDRFKSNLGSEDSLMRFSGIAFRAADKYLKNNKRDDVSSLVLAGGWVESLYLTVSDPSAVKSEALMNRIGEQKNVLNGLIEILVASDTDNSAGELVKELKALQGHFAGVTSTYTFEQPVTETASKTTYIKSKTSVTIPENTLQEIVKSVTSIRSMIIA